MFAGEEQIFIEHLDTILSTWLFNPATNAYLERGPRLHDTSDVFQEVVPLHAVRQKTFQKHAQVTNLLLVDATSYSRDTTDVDSCLV
jgi:hypothetical protein